MRLLNICHVSILTRRATEESELSWLFHSDDSLFDLLNAFTGDGTVTYHRVLVVDVKSFAKPASKNGTRDILLIISTR